jgi:hypothetical protein
MLLAGGKSSGSIWRGLLTLQGLWIGRPFVHQPAKDRCGTHRDHGMIEGVEKVRFIKAQ